MNQTFQPRTNFIWAGVAFVLIFLYVVNIFMLVENTLQIFTQLTICLLGSVAVYLIWVRPKLVLHEDAIEVVNPLRRELIPYSEVRELQTKWALTIIHARGKTSVWVAPASGKRRWIADQTFQWRSSRVPLSDPRIVGSQTTSESLNSMSGQAAYIIREHMKRSH